MKNAYFKIIFFLSVIAAIFVARLVYLQLITDRYALNAANTSIKIDYVIPQRGVIFDRNGRILVGNQPSYEISFTQSQMSADFDTIGFCNLVNISKQDFIKKVTHPALKSHPQKDLAKSQMKIIPSVFCADFKSVELAEKFIENAKIFGEKCSFGSADSRVEIPSKISHASFSKEELKAIGISDSTVRFSIGFEDLKDLKEDLLEAIK